MSETVSEGQAVLAAALRDVTVWAHGWTPEWQAAAYSFSDAVGDPPYYVGMAGNLLRRMHEHRRAGLTRSAELVEVFPCWSVAAAQRLERNLILFHHPEMNDSVPVISENEKAWYQELDHLTNPSKEEDWSWCPACGELTAVFHGAEIPATFGSVLCPLCRFLPHWDPRGECWDVVGRHLAALITGASFHPAGSTARLFGELFNGFLLRGCDV